MEGHKARWDLWVGPVPSARPDTRMVTLATTYYREEGRTLKPTVSQPKSDLYSFYKIKG